MVSVSRKSKRGAGVILTAVTTLLVPMAIAWLLLWPVNSKCIQGVEGSLSCEVRPTNIWGASLMTQPGALLLAAVVLLAAGLLGVVVFVRLRRFGPGPKSRH